MSAVRTYTAGPDTDATAAPGAEPATGLVPATGPTPARGSAPSPAVRNVQWLLENFVEEAPGVRSVAVVSSDGLPLLGSRSKAAARAAERQGARSDDTETDLAAVVSGLASLTVGAAKLMDGGRVRQTTVAMDGGLVVVMSISDGSLLGVHAAADSDPGVIAYHMALFVGRVGHVLTPALRGELRQAMESAG